MAHAPDGGAGANVDQSTQRITRSMSRSAPPILQEHGAEEHGADEHVAEDHVAPRSASPRITRSMSRSAPPPPILQEPGADEAVAEEPVAEEPVVTQEPVAEERVAEEPVADEHVAEDRVTEEPVTEARVTDEPIAEDHVAEDRVTEEPVVEEPVTEERVTEDRVADEPVPEEPIAEEPVAEDRVPINEAVAAVDAGIWVQIMEGLHIIRVCLNNTRVHLHTIRLAIEVFLYNFCVARLDCIYKISVAIRDRLNNFWVASLNRLEIWLTDTAFPAWRHVDWYILNFFLLVLSILICGRVFSRVQQGYLKRHTHHETPPPDTVSQQPFSGGTTFVDGLYWCTTTLTTVGFGDITPKTDGAKIATSFLIILGITGMAMVSQTFNDGWSEVEDCLSAKWGWSTEPRGWRWLQDLFWDNLRWWIGEWEMILRRILAAVYSVVLLFAGMMLFGYYENKFFVDAFYAAVVAESTVGYGDFFFTTKAGRICACFWLFLSTSASCRMLGLQTEHRLQRRAGRLLRQQLSVAELATINSNPNRERAYYELQMLKSGKFIQSELAWMREHYILISHPSGVHQ